jgi:PEP-CTERM motif
MKTTRWIRSIAECIAVVLAFLGSVAHGQTTSLATWDTAPTGAVFPGGDFDPNLDNMPSCSGCWYSRTGASGVTYSRSAPGGVTQGSGALQATIVGKGAGGMYAPTINGAPFELDTHFDYPLVVTYSNQPGANGGVLDPRFTAIKNAVDGASPGSFYTVEFDITYDVAQMRSIPWQPPEETVNPGPNGENRFPQRFFWVGMYGNASEPDGFTFVGFDANTINPFDSQWDNNLLPVFKASFPLEDFTFQPNSATSFYQFGFLYNSVFGTLPASSNTAGAHIYFDNLRLVEHDPTDNCDFNNDNACTLGDFQLFMAQHRREMPTLGDYDMDGDNDFLDFQEFEKFYDLANLGSGSLKSQLAGVPEPSSIAIVGLALIGLLISRGRRLNRPAIALTAAAFVSIQGIAEAQLIETFNTLGKWQAIAGAPPPSNPSVMLSSIGATQGTTSLKVTQAEDTLGGDDFIWAAGTTPNWTTGDAAFEVLRNAVNIGAEHYNLLVDVTFRPQDLVDQGVNSLSVTFGLNFNGQPAGNYAGEATQFTNTATIPLTAFNLQDVEDQGATSYSAQIGLTADAINLPFSVYVDNIRLEQISSPDLLTLEINRSNGAATLKNLSANPISWDYLEIKSAGSLDPAGWSSLDDQNAGGEGTWIEAGGSSSMLLVEASLLSSHTLAPNATLSLGSLYNEAVNAQDVDFEIRRAAGPANRTYDQIVTYIGVAPGLAGDYNRDGSVNAADYVVWRKTDGSQQGYNTWRANFGRSSGQGALSQTAAVPEPTAAVLVFSSVIALRFFQRRVV